MVGFRSRVESKTEWLLARACAGALLGYNMTAHGGIGGAASSAGVDFQQRIAAWFAIAMMSRMDIAPTLAVTNSLFIEKISMETSHSVDDLMLACENEIRVFVQAKTSPSFSEDPDSDFASAIKQFVEQYCIDKTANDIFVLAVSPSASGKIRQQLRKLTLGSRYDSHSWKTAPLTQAEQEVRDKTSTLILKFAQTIDGRLWDDVELMDFVQKLYIATFDVDESGSDTRSAYIMLYVLPQLKVPADLVWSHIVQLCLDTSKRRLQLSKNGLVLALSRYFKKEKQEDAQGSFFVPTYSGEILSGKEVLLLENPELHASDGLDKSLFLFEIRRFDEQGKPRARFKDGKCILQNGEYRLLHRAATTSGMVRYLTKNSELFPDYQILIAQAQFEENVHLGGTARARAEWIQKKLEQACRDLKCLHCDNPVSAAVAALVEIDDEEHSAAAGVVHEKCIQPMHRVLGEVKSDFFEKNRHLVDIDIHLWVERLKKGQGLMSGLREAMHDHVIIGWNPEPTSKNLRYASRIRLADGSRPAVLRRGKVHRLSQQQSKKNVAEFQAKIKQAALAGDPFCMSADGTVFGHKKQLSAFLPQEAVSECIAAEVVPYTRQLSDEFEQYADYYAPLIAVRTGEEEEYLQIGGACVLLSDILKVEYHFENWAEAGIIIPNFYLEIIANDEAFDRLMLDNTRSGRIAVIDPLLFTDGSLRSGIPIKPYDMRRS